MENVEKRLSKKAKIIIAVAVAAVVCAEAVAGVLLYNPLKLKKDTVTVEFGQHISLEASTYLKKDVDKSIVKNTKVTYKAKPVEGQSYDQIGDYTVKLKYEDKTKEVKVSVVDTTKPEFCATADAGIDTIAGVELDLTKLITATDLSGAEVTKEEELKYKTAFMLFVGAMYSKMGWAMQLHYGCKRDNNTPMFDKMGPDTGFDCINNYAPSGQMADFLNALNKTGDLPKTIIYSLNPNDDEAIGTILGCFQDSSAAAKIQQGSAWWFNDHKVGMTKQLTSLANLGCLSNFVGMLTDSRSFLSYTRHEDFRRILCDLFGTWVENVEYPKHMEVLGGIVKDISYNNAVRYFGFDLDTVE